MKRYFLGMAAGYSTGEVWRHTFAMGRKSDCRALKKYLRGRYGGESTEDTRVVLCKNGRSALCLALMAYFEPGDAVIVNGFTCYAVYEAVKSAGLTPIWTDVSREDLNFDLSLLQVTRAGDGSGGNPKNVLRSKNFWGGKEPAGPARKIAGIIIQNSLGNPVDVKQVEAFARKHELTIIEDLAHSAGVKYADGREAGTVGAAAVFSFGKDKAIDTVSGGAVVLRHPCKREIKAPSKLPKLSDHLRARFYPFFGTVCRGLASVHLGGALMRGLVKIHWVEKSADNRLDLERKISKFEARLALKQFKKFKKSGEAPLRKFCLVQNRGEVLRELQKAGYYFGGFWYERPVSPERYYKKVHFPEENCPNSVFVAKHIINLPTYYSKADLAPALKIIEKYLLRDTRGGREK